MTDPGSRPAPHPAPHPAPRPPSGRPLADHAPADRGPAPTTLERLDPTSWYRWPTTSRGGRNTFVFRYGMVGTGVPFGVVYGAAKMLAALVRVGGAALADWDKYFLHNGVFGGLFVGTICGVWLWERGEAKYQEAMLARRFRLPPPLRPTPPPDQAAADLPPAAE